MRIRSKLNYQSPASDTYKACVVDVVVVVETITPTLLVVVYIILATFIPRFLTRSL